MKDELQTVPVLSAKSSSNRTKKQRSTSSSNMKISSLSKKEDLATSTAASNGTSLTLPATSASQHLILVDLKTETVDNNNNNNYHGSLMQLSKRRDTDNSLASTGDSSSNLDSSNPNNNSTSFSPINLDSQETMKLEKKRERNREAARKCRTRKLEKIATLELQVQKLIDTNNQERAKTNALNEEILNLRKKLEAHQKAHNCNLNLS